MTAVKKWAGKILASIFLFFCWIWCLLAIRFSGLPETFAFISAGIFAAGAPIALLFLPNRNRTVYGVLALCFLISIGWSWKKPSHDRDWQPSVAKLPTITIERDQIRVHNIRNFEYRTEKDFTVRYYDKTFDLNKLETIDYALSYWDGKEAVAPLILSFGFGDGDYLALSSETRLEQGEPQSGMRGLFKQY